MRRAIFLLGLVACSDPIPVAKEVPGFRMPVDKTRVALGAPTVTTEIDGFQRVEGPLGAYLTFLPTGGTMGSVSDTTLLAKGPAFATAKDHENAVWAYFTGAGLPSDQVASAVTGTLVGSDGTSRFTTSLARRVEGVDVIESIASAILVEGNVAIKEQVFWPGFLRTVVDDAHTLQSQGLANLPTTNKVGVVAIHHASWKTVPFIAFATLDVIDGGAVRHFDVDGNEKTLPP